MKKIFAMMAALVVSTVAVPASAMTLPNGECSSVRGMTVTIKGGSIKNYTHNGRGYEVVKRSAYRYKLGEKGQLFIKSVNGRAFDADFQFGSARPLPSTFECR